MARDEDQERKARFSLKQWLSPGLRHRSFRHPRRSSGSVSQLPLLREHSALEPAPAAGAPATPLALASSLRQQGSEAGDGGDGAAAAAAHPLAGCGLMVRLLQARGLRAADSNGLSDPYCVVKVGEHKASSRTELKTLEPRWNETMCFSAEDVAEALQGSRPYVALRVYDWDLVSADDFLGQAELAFDSLGAPGGGPQAPAWLPLYGYGRGGRKVDAGEVQVAAWFQAGGLGQQDGSATSTLCCPPGTRKQVPQVVHSRHGVLYEEPLIACLAVTLDRVERALATGAAVAAANGTAGSSPPPDSPLRRPSSILVESPARARRLLGRLFVRKGGGGAANGGLEGRTLAHSSSMRSSVSDGMAVGEDPGDEYDGLDFYSGGDSGIGASELGLGPDGDEEGPAELLSPGDPASPGLSPTHVGLGQGSSDGAGLARPSLLTRPRTFMVRDTELEGAEPAQAGMRMYVRLVLGRQKQTSWIKRDRSGGAANWHQTFVFATPLPLRNRQLRLELYRTASSTQRGRLVSVAHVWLHDLVPPGLEEQPQTCRQSEADLEPVARGQPGGRVLLRSTLVDADGRRAMYRAAYLEGEAAEAGGGAGGAADGEAGSDGEAGDVRHVQRLESLTAEYSRRELRKKAMLSEASFTHWEQSHRHRTKQAVLGAVPYAAQLAHDSWRAVSRYLSAGQEAPGDDPAAAPDAPPTPSPGVPRLPAPAGSLSLTVGRLTLAAPPAGDCFFVLKCGPHWGRSRALHLGGRPHIECGWQLELPVLDPAALLTLVLFQHARGHKTAERLRPGFLPSAAAVTPVGKLRVRLSCLRPNTAVTADLVLLGDRARGAREAGAVQLSLEARYGSMAALFKGYAAPRLPTAAYAHGLDERAHQAVMARECRRIVLRWLDGANPSVSAAEALVVLDAEREVFAVSRARVNMRRVRMALVGLRRFKRRFDAIKAWHEPWESVAAIAGSVMTCFVPHLALPLLLAWVVAATLAVQPDFEEGTLRMEPDPPDIEPENESLEATTVNPLANLRARLDRLQRLGLLVQTALDEVASAMERAGALLSWQDPSATTGVLCVLSALALLIFLLGLPAVLSFAVFVVLRPPALRTPTPPLPVVVFGKLPTRGDRMV